MLQVTVAARYRGKHDVSTALVETGDFVPPSFSQPPLLQGSTNALTVSFAVDEPATAHWVLAYNDVSADYRYQLVGFESSKLSTDQVMEVTGRGEAATVLRRLQQTETADTMGPIVGWGTVSITQPNKLVTMSMRPPCLNDTGMCLLSFGALNPETGYKVCCQSVSC
jgi:hypothetical protein